MAIFTNESFSVACIGIFWLTKDLSEVAISLKSPIFSPNSTEKYGEFRISKFQHSVCWDKLKKDGKLPAIDLDADNYTSIPRGRLTYNYENASVMVIGGEWIHNKNVQELLKEEFNLDSVKYYFRDEGRDAHYKDFAERYEYLKENFFERQA